MHDPQTVAFEIRSPIRRKPDRFFPKGYRPPLVTIWHVDPERDGSDDSCGWFIRGRHLAEKDRELARYLIENDHDNLRGWFPDCDQQEAINRIRGVFAALRRSERPWWKHPRWHFWHWKFQVHPWQTFRRWALSRCSGCGKRFPWGYSPVGFQWNSKPPRWFRGETDVYHQECANLITRKPHGSA